MLPGVIVHIFIELVGTGWNLSFTDFLQSAETPCSKPGINVLTINLQQYRQLFARLSNYL